MCLVLENILLQAGDVVLVEKAANEENMKNIASKHLSIHHVHIA